MAKMLYFAACLALALTAVECSKILIIAGTTARSHYNVITPIIEELANRKHDITVQAFHNLEKPRSNVKELKITQPKYTEDPAVLKQLFLNTLSLGPIGQMRNYIPYTRPYCIGYLTDETTKVLLSEGRTYDLVIVDTLFFECHLAVASLVAHYIMDLYTTAWFPWKETDVPTPPSYVPNFMLITTSKMNFFQRLENVISMLGVRYVYRYNLNPGFQEVISKLLPQAGAIEEMERKITFSLTNGDPVLLSPRPSMPNVVHCGGMHCREAKPLPKELNDLVESSGNDGFILFGLGSNMRSEYLSPELVQNILLAFSRLKQKVIWKFEAKLENVPQNVKIVEWMPQQDLLGHPKARLFITHSGLLSLQEAVYHGVPVIGIPFFSDQAGNIARIEELGIGERLDFLNITTDNLYQLVTKIISDKSYYNNMKKYSAIFKDQPDRPVDRAVHWIEYVIRHDGASHLRTAAEDLNFFQYFLLDVIGFALFVGLSLLGFGAYIAKLTWCKLCERKQSKVQLDKKRK